MAIRYQRGLKGLVAKNNLRLVTIAIGSELSWTGGVTQSEQMELLEMMQRFQKAHPVESLRLVEKSTKTVSNNGVHPTPTKATQEPIPAPSVERNNPILNNIQRAHDNQQNATKKK